MNRNIALSIVFTIITCGIYGIYWFIMLTDEWNEKHPGPGDGSGAFSFVITLITCGIYGLYWAYKLGEKVDEFKRLSGFQASGNYNILFLVLQIFGFNVIVLAIAQNELDQIVPQNPSGYNY